MKIELLINILAWTLVLNWDYILWFQVTIELSITSQWTQKFMSPAQVSM